MRPPFVYSARAAFSLLELVVVILIMSILAGVVVPRIIDRQANARDARRLADVKALRGAIEQYELDKGAFPAADGTGWDRSNDATFISALVDEGYLAETPEDPLNDATYYYAYYVYDKGSYGCAGDGDYYVLGIKNFETDDYVQEHTGFFQCASRNWNNEFDYVTGGGASPQ